MSGDFELKVNRNEAARPFTIIGGNELIAVEAEDSASARGSWSAQVRRAVGVDPV